MSRPRIAPGAWVALGVLALLLLAGPRAPRLRATVGVLDHETGDYTETTGPAPY